MHCVLQSVILGSKIQDNLAIFWNLPDWLFQSKNVYFPNLLILFWCKNLVKIVLFVLFIYSISFGHDVAYGNTKIFIRTPNTLVTLEENRAQLIPHIIVLLQKVSLVLFSFYLLILNLSLRFVTLTFLKLKLTRMKSMAVYNKIFRLDWKI